MSKFESRIVLLVEDNPYDEKLTVKALESSGFPCKIRVARDGVEALDYLFSRGKYETRPTHEQASLIILDLKLPKMDGLEVLREIRANRTTELIPVIILTSSREEGDVVKSYKTGAYSYIQKPVDYDKFSEVAKQIGAYWLLINECPPAC